MIRPSRFSGFLIGGTSLRVMVVITVSDESNIIRGQFKFSLKDRGGAETGFHKKEILTVQDSGKIMVKFRCVLMYSAYRLTSYYYI